MGPVLPRLKMQARTKSSAEPAAGFVLMARCTCVVFLHPSRNGTLHQPENEARDKSSSCVRESSLPGRIKCRFPVGCDNGRMGKGCPKAGPFSTVQGGIPARGPCPGESPGKSAVWKGRKERQGSRRTEKLVPRRSTGTDGWLGEPLAGRKMPRYVPARSVRT